MDDPVMAARPWTLDAAPMPSDPLVLAHLLALAGMTAGTGEYAAIVRRRTERRRLDEQRRLDERRQTEAAGLQGLVRVLLVDWES